MRIQILADLHMEFGYSKVELVKDAEVLVIAGDYTVANKLGMLDTLARSTQKPIVFVAGNHDYYDGVFDAVNMKLEEISSASSNFHFLNNASVEIGEVRFIGSTLWSNFDLAPNPLEFAELVGHRINDFYWIHKSSNHRFTPYDCLELNEKSRSFLRNERDSPYHGKKVVVTHFGPSPRSIHPKYEGDVLNPYFACNCEDLMDLSVPLWIHGHTHQSIDYVHNGSHVIANPKGYYDENGRFNGKLVVVL